mgnify:FL=1
MVGEVSNGVSGVVLAAGEAKRMGRQKLLLDFKGKPVLLWVLEAALSSDLSEVVCVVRERSEILREMGSHAERIHWVTNQNAHDGQSTSLVAGLEALSPRSGAALFLVGDQPFMDAQLINGIIRLYEKEGAPLVVPVFKGETRNPVLFARSLFPELLRLSGDRGAKGLVQKHESDAAFLEWGDESPFLDLDNWRDYERLRFR